MRNLTLSVIATIILGGMGFLFLGTIMTRTLEQIEIPTLAIFSVLCVSFAIVFAINAERLSKKQIHDVTGTIDGKNL